MSPVESGQRGVAAGRAVSATWGTPFVAGLFMVALGILAFIAAGIASLATIFAFGALLLVAGLMEVVYAFQARRQGSFLLPLLSGLLSLVVGALFLFRPLAGLAATSLMLAAFFLASGLFRGITAIADRYAHWGWDLFYGVVAIVLGVLLLSGWPTSSIVTIGVLVGAELIARGSTLMGASLALRRGLRPAAT